jgi:hypothetical protein
MTGDHVLDGLFCRGDAPIQTEFGLNAITASASHTTCGL